MAKRAASTSSAPAPPPAALPTVGDVVAAVHRIAPPALAESWDNVGLQVGDPAAPAGAIMTALEVSTPVLREVQRLGVGTLVTHHPLIFRPLKSLAETSTAARLVAGLIRNGTALIAAHTNLDSVASGTNGELADRLGVMASGRRFLQPAPPSESHVKIIVYTPIESCERVFGAMAAAGAGTMGRYSHASFRTPGVGTFRPLDGANPAIGAIGQTAHVEEIRLEMMAERSAVRRVLDAMIAAHPYEVPAYEVHALVSTAAPTAGLGLTGELREPATLGAMADRARTALGINSVGIVGRTTRRIRTVAICTGSGGEFIRNGRAGAADLFITGEMTHHDCAEADELGIAVLLVGHYASEVIVCQRFADMISQELGDAGFPEIRPTVSRKQANPLKRLL